MDTHELAWAAGLFDGEGCTSFFINRDPARDRVYGAPQLAVTQKDREVLDRFQRAVGLGRVGGPSKHGMYRYVVTRASEAIAVIEKLSPWLSSVKREQAARVFERYRTQREELAAVGRKPRVSISEGTVRQIRADFATGQFNTVRLSEKYGLTTVHISRIVRHVTWKNVG